MALNVFLELVEIKAKTASVIPFLLGMCFSYFYFNHLNWGLAAVFFVAMFLFNMVVDMLDNYHDYYHAKNKSYQKNTNIIGRENIPPKLVLSLMIIFTAISIVLGLLLVVKAGVAVLWMGMFCFLIGFWYSSTRFAISNLPLGELFSGFTMGFMIVLLSVYINSYQVFIWNWTNVLSIFLVALADELWISNLMLTNNLCDQAEDESNKRKTIVHFIGKKGGLIAFSIKNCLAFLIIWLLPFWNLAPKTVWLTVLIVPFVYQQNKLLIKKQVKTETFICGVKTLFVGSSAYLITYFIGLLFR